MSTTTTPQPAQPAKTNPALPTPPAAKPVEAPAAVPNPWEAPVAIGDIVWWYADGKRGDRPSVAIVTAIGMQSLNLNVISPMHYQFAIKDGVRHVDDPRTKANDKVENGGWEHRPQHLRLQALEALVSRMAKDLNYQ